MQVWNYNLVKNNIVTPKIRIKRGGKWVLNLGMMNGDWEAENARVHFTFRCNLSWWRISGQMFLYKFVYTVPGIALVTLFHYLADKLRIIKLIHYRWVTNFTPFKGTLINNKTNPIEPKHLRLLKTWRIITNNVQFWDSLNENIYIFLIKGLPNKNVQNTPKI